MPSQNNQNKADDKPVVLNTPNLGGSALPMPVGSIRDSDGNMVEIEEVPTEGVEELPESLLPSDPMEALDTINRLRDGSWGVDEEAPEPEPVELSREMLIGFAKRNGITALIGLVSDAVGEMGYICEGDFVHHKSGMRIKP